MHGFNITQDFLRHGVIQKNIHPALLMKTALVWLVG